MSSTLGVGIIGAGQIAALHAKGYQADPRARIRAVCDAREHTAIERAMAWKADRYYTDYRELLADPSVDVVDIMTPHYLHAPMALEALRAGKHVLVQRPLALTVAEADRLMAEAQKRELHLCVAESSVFHPPLTDAKGYLESGEIGEPVSVRIKVGIGAPEGGWAVRPESWLWRFDAQKCGGGPFLFDAIYSSFVSAFHLLGQVDVVQAWLGRTEIYPGYFVDAPATMMWRHRWRGCPGSLEMTYSPEMYIKSSHYPVDARIELTGTKGIIWLRTNPGDVTMSAPIRMYRDGRMFSFGEVSESWDENFQAMITNFLDAIYGINEARFRPDTGREILRLTLAARDANRSERPQKLQH
jgi:predicted dehydrogenase